MTTLPSSLRSRSGLLAAGTAFTLCASITSATIGAIVHNVPVNGLIPDTLDGLYMNVVTSQTAATSFADYDINPYSAAAGQFNLWGPTVNTWFAVGGAAGNYNLSQGTPIQGAADAFFRPGAGLNLASQMNLNSDQNLLGFRFVNESNGNQIHFGWMRIAFGTDAGTRIIVEYAYEDQAGVGIGAGVVPAPATLTILAFAVFSRPRRRS